MTSGVYEIVNTTNGKKYVGSAAAFRTRFAVHRHELRNGTHHSARLQNAWNKYGEGAFAFRKLLICSKDMLTFYEQRVLDAFVPEYNILRIARSSLGYKHTPEALAKMSTAQKSRKKIPRGPLSEEAKAKIGAANTGRVVSEETRAKLREARKGRTPAKGMVHSAAAKAAVSLAHKGKKRDPESIEAGAAKRRGRPRSEESKLKQSAAMIGRRRTPESIVKGLATKRRNKELLHISTAALLRKDSQNG